MFPGMIPASIFFEVFLLRALSIDNLIFGGIRSLNISTAFPSGDNLLKTNAAAVIAY